MRSNDKYTLYIMSKIVTNRRKYLYDYYILLYKIVIYLLYTILKYFTKIMKCEIILNFYINLLSIRVSL